MVNQQIYFMFKLLINPSGWSLSLNDSIQRVLVVMVGKMQCVQSWKIAWSTTGPKYLDSSWDMNLIISRFPTLQWLMGLGTFLYLDVFDQCGINNFIISQRENFFLSDKVYFKVKEVQIHLNWLPVSTQ